jgi:hypothetical protein
MPGPFTHIYTARRVADFLASGGVTPDFIRPHDDALSAVQKLLPDLVADLGTKQCAAKMNAWPKFTALGAVGPDLFFFLQDYNNVAIPCDEIMLAMSILYMLDDQGRLDDPYAGLVAILAEVNQTWAGILKFIIKLDQIWQKFLDVWNSTIGGIVDAAGKVVDDLTGGLFSSLGQAFTELANDLEMLAIEEIVSEGDVFGWFSLKMRLGYDEQAFLWSDMTHYRRTSMVPARLIAHAREMAKSANPLDKEHADQLVAYALGWVCHVGTDTIAHSFVNEQCGGPFRTHWQRHHLIENHMDAFNYEQTKPGGTLPQDPFIGFVDTYDGLNQSALYFAVQIPQKIDTLAQAAKQGDHRQPLPDGDDQAAQDQRKKLLDTDGELPLWLANVLAQVLIEVYAHPSEGGMKDLQGKIGEGDQPHPRNLNGQVFQDGLDLSTDLIGKWLQAFGVDNAGMALGDLRKLVAPDPPFKIPEGFPMPWEIQTAYRFMLSWFKRSYISQFSMDKPQRPTVFTPPGSDFDFGPPDFSGVNSSDDPLSEICEAILALFAWLFKTIEQIGQIIYDTLKTIASAATWPAREAIYAGIILPAWEMAESIRLVLVHMGFLMPSSEVLYDDGEIRVPNEIDLEVITLGHTVDAAFQSALASAWDPLGNLDHDPALTNEGLRDPLGAPNPWLPVRVTKGTDPPAFGKLMNNDVIEYTRPWAFPDRTNDPDPRKSGNHLETPLTVAGPYRQNDMPNKLLATSALASNIARVLYEQAGCPDDTDTYNRAFVLHKGDGHFGEGKFEGTNPLGDPVVFSSYLIGQIANNPSFVSSFNLDADRGYGYLCWDWDRVAAQPGQAMPTDGRNHAFPRPVEWPEGADKTQWVRPGPVPFGGNDQRFPAMHLHYPGRTCKEHAPGGTPGSPTGAPASPAGGQPR